MVELVDQRHALLHRREAVHPPVDVPAGAEEALQDVQHLLGLREQEHPVALLLPGPQNLLDHLHLPAPLRAAVVRVLRRVLPLQQVRVVADLPHHVDAVEGVPAPVEDLLHLRARQERPVECPLLRGEAAEEDVLGLLGELRVHVGLHPPEEVGHDQVPQHHRAPVRRGDLQRRGVGVAADGDGEGELRLEDGQHAELPREDEVEERPELRQLVLDGGAGHDYPVHGLELLADQGDLRVGVSDPVALVEHRVPPLDVQQLLPENPQLLVGGEEQPRVRPFDGSDQVVPSPSGCRPRRRWLLPLLFLAIAAVQRSFAFGVIFRVALDLLPGPMSGVVKDVDLKLGVPVLRLPLPLPQEGDGANDDAGLVQSAEVKGAQEGYDLDGLPQAHLVADDSAGSLAVQFPQPLHSDLLVLEELGEDHVGDLQAPFEHNTGLLAAGPILDRSLIFFIVFRGNKVITGATVWWQKL